MDKILIMKPLSHNEVLISLFFSLLGFTVLLDIDYCVKMILGLSGESWHCLRLGRLKELS